MARHHRQPFNKRAQDPGRGAAALLAIQGAIMRSTLLLPHERQTLMAPVHTAFAHFRAGRGTVEFLMQLADALHIGQQLAARGICNDHVAELDAGVEALKTAHERHAANGCWTLTGPEIAALDQAVFVNKVQLDHCTQGEFQAAVQSVINRVRQACAGNAAPGVLVVDPARQNAYAAEAAAMAQ